MNIPELEEVSKSIHIKNREFCFNKYRKFTEYIEDLYPQLQHIERLYRFYHPDFDNTCPVCNNKTKFINFNKGYSKYCCPGCASKDNKVKEKKKNTTLINYGVDNPSKSKIILDKKRHTMLTKYGVVNTSKLKSNRDKAKQTCLVRYGDENYNNIEKSKQTCLEKYGVEFFLSNKKIIERISETCQQKYGGRGNASNLLKEKSKQTCLERYGDENYNNRQKAKQTMLKYYGSESYRKFMPHKETNIEVFILDILNEYNIPHEVNNRIILNGKELDIYIPSKNIAIECNGYYWHSSEHKQNNYHYQKFIDCERQGIQLLTIWDDQIYRCDDIVKSIIKSKLGIYDCKIYARKCCVKNIDSKTCKEFLVENHLQGAVNCGIRYGLFYNDELVSIMTFGKNRKCVNGQNGWELYRYCTKLNTLIIGGASKLFNKFINDYNPDYITSFSSNDISNGSLYNFLNFKRSNRSISYWYMKNNNRYHRYKFAKHILVKEGFDPNKTEFEIMNERGFYRIYDSGQTKWEWQSMQV